MMMLCFWPRYIKPHGKILNVKGNKMAKKYFLLTLLVLIFLYHFSFGYTWATDGKGERAPMRIPVKVIKADKKNLSSTLSMMGAINHLSKVDVSSEITGVLESIKVEEGDRVQEGQVVAVVDSALFQAQLKQSQSSLELAKIDLLKSENEIKKAESKVNSSRVAQEKLKRIFEAQEKLFSIEGIVQKDLDEAEVRYQKGLAEYQAAVEEMNALLAKSDEGHREAEAKVKKAEADVEEYQTKIQKSIIKAPISGVVSVKKKSSGEAISLNDSLILTLVAIDLVYAEVDLNEKNIGFVKVGQNAKVVTDAYPNQPFLGRVYSLSPVVDSSSRTVKVKIKIANPKGLLKPGMFSRVEITEQSRPNVLAIPEEALIRTKDGQPIVFVIIDEIAFLRPVETGNKKEGWVEIKKGLKVGERVVIEGQDRLGDLSPVQSTELTK